MESPLLSVIEDEHRRHPGMTVRDLGKLLYQAVFGGDHWTRTPDAFLDALRAEWEHGLPPIASATAIQPIDPDGKTARLHLAESRAAGLTLEALTSFLTHQPLKRGESARWERLVRAAERLAADGEIPFAAPEIHELLQGSGPHHHGPTYGPTAYRLIHDMTDRATHEWIEAHGLSANLPGGSP